jgi:hypothetical protein
MTDTNTETTASTPQNLMDEILKNTSTPTIPLTEQQAIGAKQRGIAKASRNKQQLVAMARRIAREKAQLGPVTIDDVAQELEKSNVYKPSKRRLWHGGVFTTSEWICIGDMQSRVVTNNARVVKVWALKSWLDSHPLDGTEWDVSSFRLAGIFRRFESKHPGVALERCNWCIGTDMLSDESKQNIIAGKHTLYGIPVTLVEGIGAVLMPPRKLQPAQA